MLHQVNSAFHPLWVKKMSSKLQLDVRHLIRCKRHLVNAYEVKPGMVFLAG